jgi:putative ABC transport system permease protein
MTMPKETPRWRRYLRFWGTNPRADVEDEFSFHLQERVEELMTLGLDARAAREEAMRGFGDMEQVKEACRHLAEEQETMKRRSELLSALKQDAVVSLRLMRTNPSLTAAVLLTLALGIGGTTAIFSVVNAVLLRALPYTGADRIVVVWETFGEATSGRASGGHFTDWSKSKVFEAVSLWQNRTYTITGGGDPERVAGARVSSSFFQVQHMPPVVGRYFQPGENADSRVVVLSHPFWQTRFSGDRSILGREIMINGEAHTVIGITPASFTLTEFDDRLWTAFDLNPEQRTNYGAHTFLTLAKLKPGVTLAQAQSEMERITADIRTRQPVEMTNRGVNVQSLREALIGGLRTQLWVLLSAVGLVLLIGCGNIASLLLARASGRRKEIAIRSALGGGRARLIRQLLTESLVLALIGGAAGLLVARLGVRFLVGMGPAGVPRLTEAGLQPDVLAFAFLVTVFCGVAFGLAPALRATRLDLQMVLREGGRSSRGTTRDRVRSLLVVTEIAVALVLLISAGLFIRSALLLQRIPAGFDPANVTMVRVALPQDRYADAVAVEAAFGRMVEQIRAIPGVEAAAASTRVPMWGQSIDIGLRVDGKPNDPNQVNAGHVRLVTADFLDALRIPVKRGRAFTDNDLANGAPRVVLINETLARRLFAESNPIGQRVSGWTARETPEWREVIGVVGDVRAFGLENEAPPEIYMPFTQAPQNAWNAFQRNMTLVARTRGSTSIAPAVRAAVQNVDPMLALFDLQSMEEVMSRANATRRFNTMLLTLLGLTGLVLAAIGIYGVVAFFVTQRTHEIGVRMALGATAKNVVGLVVGQAALLAVFGVLLGGTVSYWATKSLQSMLFDVEATDPVAYSAAAVVLVGIAVLAALLPARKAARIDPLRSLGMP